MLKYVIATLGSLLLLMGCQQKNALPSPNHKSATPQRVSYDQRVKQTHPSAHRSHSPQVVANRLVQIATKQPHVNNATAISLGRYTLVGLDVDADLDRARVGTVKYTVAQALKKDPNGSNALVTADTDLVQRIRELSRDVAKGHPIKGMMEELADIAGRIAPQPSKTVPSRVD
ncbi:sporulation lipoprotein, YhcN/YlaJ family [Seinonella peptonophila]|uniref:Sporulation lipoprotein, YhcN/YlaJ family n=1 Tax=Seinonella peptonophila TaxID=112248 RepID=A0A1M4V0W9_9BACL|nr:YhcN/YlaJ family sporulation lipoprotein [Seinonella peptonophila]SHE62595.1 sporulation lipoprotein, YhcN/YlaJ family [Seinonella peptonophila]